MKKALSLLLCLSLGCGLALPAMAAEAPSADARLSAVTEKVKATLELDTAAYPTFQGDLEESSVLPTWQLRWSGEDGELYIVATESGKILSYNVMEGGYDVAGHQRSFGASFPKLSRADAQKTAETFLGKVLDSGVETPQVDNSVGSGRLSATSHNFYGDVLEHGLPSPFGFRISVRVSDNTVTSYYLTGSPEDYSGTVPDPDPAAAATKAASDLKNTLSLRLEYVLSEDGKSAALRYLPNDVHDYYVDAQTGRLVDLTELRKDLWDKGAGGTAESAPSAAADSAGRENGLTEAEQAGIAQLEGVMSKQDLDAAARKVSALGLTKYTMGSAAYRVDKETGVVSAALQYAYKSGESIYRRTVTLDAKTGAILSVYSNRPWNESAKVTLNDAQMKTRAESFLKTVCPDQFGKTGLYESPNATEQSGLTRYFLYAQKVNGYFCPDSSITVAVDGTDGSIATYYNNVRDEAVFESADGIISADAALNAWYNTYAVTLGYIGVPEKLDLSAPEWKPLIEAGRSYLYTQKLGWYLDRDGWFLGVDAKTGKAVESPSYDQGTISYDDLDGHWVKAQAETLAAYGVGWLGGALQGGRTLTQIDLVALLVSTDGYLYSPEEGADQLYDIAYSMGILTKAERSDSAELTRGQLVKMLLDGAGYGDVAKLQGIFQCSYSDAASIPAQYYGYAALAQGLGIVKGDKTAAFAAGKTATRAEAVSMLYNFMSR